MIPSRTLQRSSTISRSKRGIIFLLITAFTASIFNIVQLERLNQGRIDSLPLVGVPKLYGKNSKIQHLGNFSTDHPEPMFPSHLSVDTINKEICEFRAERAGSNQLSVLRPGFIVKYVTLGGASYIMWLQLFVDTMQLFGILLEDIVVLSLDKETTDHFKSHGITIIPYYRDQVDGTKCATESNFTAMRCQVSYGKAHVILELLKEGYAVFFSDADVFFYKHPVQSLKVHNPNLDLYTQADHLDVKTFANFGVMLVYPGEMAKYLFRYIYNTVHLDIDQHSYNNWLKRIRHADKENNAVGICGGDLDYELVGQATYFNAMLTFKNDGNDGNIYNHSLYDQDITLFHSTCVEGAHTKAFAALCMFPRKEKTFYLNRKSVTIDKKLNVSDWEGTEKILQALALVAKSTGRAVRVNMISNATCIYDRQSPFAVISAYQFHEDGIDLLEPNFWENAKKYANISPFRTNVSIHDNNWPDFSSKSDELVLGVDDIISAEATTNKSYTCAQFQEKQMFRWCLHVCDMGHF